jgi:hypothetical protein
MRLSLAFSLNFLTLDVEILVCFSYRIVRCGKWHI